MDKHLKILAQAEYDPLCLPPRKRGSGCPVPSTRPFRRLKDIPPPESGASIIARQRADRHSNQVEATHQMVALRSLDAPICWVGRQWAVTAYGVEQIKCGGYHIPKNLLSDPHWFDQMKGKNWVDVDDLTEALSFARDLYKITVHCNKCETSK